MSAGPAVIVAIVFVWLGMVLAISFVEAPLKFRAPDVSLRVGLGIGRLVFRALNQIEAAFAVVVVAVVAVLHVDAPVVGAAAAFLAAAVLVLVVQLLAVRPRLARRSDAVLAGRDAPRSHAHYAYVGLELVKVVALAAGGILVLAG
jgi:hypothetical protein